MATAALVILLPLTQWQDVGRAGDFLWQKKSSTFTTTTDTLPQEITSHISCSGRSARLVHMERKQSTGDVLLPYFIH